MLIKLYEFYFKIYLKSYTFKPTTLGFVICLPTLIELSLPSKFSREVNLKLWSFERDKIYRNIYPPNPNDFELL